MSDRSLDRGVLIRQIGLGMMLIGLGSILRPEHEDLSWFVYGVNCFIQGWYTHHWRNR